MTIHPNVTQIGELGWGVAAGLFAVFRTNGQAFPAHLTLAPPLAARSLGFTFLVYTSTVS